MCQMMNTAFLFATSALKEPVFTEWNDGVTLKLWSEGDSSTVSKQSDRIVHINQPSVLISE